MARLKMTAALMMALIGSAQAETAQSGGLLSSLLGIRGSAPAAPLQIHSDPSAKAKAQPTAIGKQVEKAKTAKAEPIRSEPVAPAKDKSAKADKPKPVKQASTKPAAPIDPAPAVAATDIDTPAEAPKPKKPPLGPFRGGGSQAVCVRTCDGFFFPVNYEGAHSDDRYAEACASSCPASPTAVYFMPRGGDLHSAATARGERYVALASAFKYRKERDATCTCKSETQTWSEILKPVDALIKHDKRDVLVTAEKSMELARPIDPEVAKAEAEAAAAAKKSARRGKKAGDKLEAKAPPKPDALRADISPSNGRDLMKGGAGGPWTNTKTFVKIDPEPTASIRTSGE